MIKRNLGAVALCGLLMAASGSLMAHHSLAGVYDMKVDKELTGTVTTVKFTNPHGSLAFNVKNADGTTTEWVMTLGSATALAQKGVPHVADGGRVIPGAAKSATAEGTGAKAPPLTGCGLVAGLAFKAEAGMGGGVIKITEVLDIIAGAVTTRILVPGALAFDMGKNHIR